MNRPPYLLKLRVKSTRHSVRLWLPLFLMWPVVLVFLLAIFLPIALLATLFTWRLGWWRLVVLGLPAFLRLICSLRGLTVDVGGDDRHVQVVFQ